MSNFAESAIADAIQQHQLFGTPKWPKPIAMLYDVRSHAFANEWNSCQFWLRGSVNIYRLCNCGDTWITVRCRCQFGNRTPDIDKHREKHKRYQDSAAQHASRFHPAN